jgi:hypothetical protein
MELRVLPTDLHRELLLHTWNLRPETVKKQLTIFITGTELMREAKRKHMLWGFVAILAMIGISAAPVRAQVAKWTPWKTVNCPKMGCSLSVSFSEVNPTTYSWKFRNDGTQSVYIQFKYTYVDADSKQLTTQPDMFPKALGPGEVWGGWATYTAHTRWNGYTGGPPVTIAITSVRLGDQAATQQPSWTDPTTGLSWTHKDNESDVDWTQASSYCANLSLGGHSDWRLPTGGELENIDDATQNLHIKGGISVNSGWYWSDGRRHCIGCDGHLVIAHSFTEGSNWRPAEQSDSSRALCVRQP